LPRRSPEPANDDSHFFLGLFELNPTQWRVSDLFFIVAICALAARLLTGESMAVAIASIVVLISSIGICLTAWISATDLHQKIRFTFREKRVGALGNRIKWLLLDGLIVVWLLLAISLANFILENYVRGAKVQLVFSLIFGPVLAYVYFLRAGGQAKS
jgi:hypothetical protein